MKIPAIRGLIRRRVLANYRVAPEIVQALLPATFRPKLVHGWAIAGICLIRLEQIRPKGFPKFVGICSENSAHRIAVEWEGSDGPKEGVFIPRRDTDSRMNSLAGGRIFPGVHHFSSFKVTDEGGEISLCVTPRNWEGPLVELKASESTVFPSDSAFSSLAESSVFFEAGSIGYSSRPKSGQLDGLLLKAGRWEVSPLRVESVHSSFYEDDAMFPMGSIEFDHALLMRDIPHEWHAEPEMRGT